MEDKRKDWALEDQEWWQKYSAMIKSGSEGAYWSSGSWVREADPNYMPWYAQKPGVDQAEGVPGEMKYTSSGSYYSSGSYIGSGSYYNYAKYAGSGSYRSSGSARGSKGSGDGRGYGLHLI